MKALIDRIFQLGYVLVALLFLVSGFVLVVLACMELWQSIVGNGDTSPSDRFDACSTPSLCSPSRLLRSNSARPCSTRK